jgi:hypothetical protein
MTKTELVKALMDAGLAPQDLQDEYCHAQAAARNRELEIARDKLAACMINYKHIFAGDKDKLTSDMERTEKLSVIEDLKNMESATKRIKQSKELDPHLSALDMFIQALDH